MRLTNTLASLIDLLPHRAQLLLAGSGGARGWPRNVIVPALAVGLQLHITNYFLFRTLVMSNDDAGIHGEFTLSGAARVAS